MESETDWCLTQTNISKISFRWTISNFSLRPERVGQTMESSIFPANGKTAWWCLRLYPKGHDETKDSISLYLELVECTPEEVKAKVKFSFVHPDNLDVGTRECSIHTFNHVSKSWGYKYFLENRPPLTEFLTDDILTIDCEIRIFENSETIFGKMMTETRIELPRDRLLDDFESLFSSEKYADIIICVTGQKFPAHKNILASRSEVFQAMLEYDMEEKLHNRIEILDINPEIFREMLRFIYTGKVKNLQEVAKELLVAADKYSLERLKVMCEQSLLENISTENVPEVLVLADAHNSEQLKCGALKFIVRNLTAVKDTKAWKTLIDDHPPLVTEVLCTAFAEEKAPLEPPPVKKFRQ